MQVLSLTPEQVSALPEQERTAIQQLVSSLPAHKHVFLMPFISALNLPWLIKWSS